MDQRHEARKRKVGDEEENPDFFGQGQPGCDPAQPQFLPNAQELPGGHPGQAKGGMPKKVAFRAQVHLGGRVTVRKRRPPQDAKFTSCKR